MKITYLTSALSTLITLGMAQDCDIMCAAIYSVNA